LKDTLRLEPVVGLDFILEIAQVREMLPQSSLEIEKMIKCKSCLSYSSYVTLEEPPLRASYDFTQTISTVFELVV